MRADSTTVSEMFEVLRLKVVDAGPPPKIIRFKDTGGSILCEVDFDDITEDSFVPGDFYFEDVFNSRILRGIVDIAGTASSLEIYDDAETNVILSGDVGLLNSGADIEFNSVDWEVDQVVIISSLKIIFPTES